MKRKNPATRRAKAAGRHLVGVKLTSPPTTKQLGALKKLFTPKALASVGIAAGAGITKQYLAPRPSAARRRTK